MDIGTTLTRFLVEQQRRFPGVSGRFTALLEEIATAAKLIGSAPRSPAVVRWVHYLRLQYHALVYTTGSGIHGFTLDPTIGEFLLSHHDIQMPEQGTIYSVNEAHAPGWGPRVRAFADGLKGSGRAARYVGSLVSDFHRNLLKGGLFLYPTEERLPAGKLRLVYEANPLGFIAEQAGGSASTGTGPILDLVPAMHQRVPLAIGSRQDIADYEAALAAPKETGP